MNNVLSAVSTTRLKTKDGKGNKAKAIPDSGPKKTIPKTDGRQNR